ncbi:hypothetical protein E3N88_29925 [Mikania micrantha]|uniref:Uncharacterized protein n=1 Tax=Mikania micrantha TaxID=192012 RepID=A0A5N6MKY1_9ASTR|nr:hypothetical protein E3N88_29925 [Mikania micrantha]
MWVEWESTERASRPDGDSADPWPFGRMCSFGNCRSGSAMGVQPCSKPRSVTIPRISVVKSLDPLYFLVEDVEGYAWAKESLELVEKQESYGGLKVEKTLKW